MKWWFIKLSLALLLPVVMVKSEECRIVSLSPALTEIVCYLGGGKSLAGRCSACDQPPEVKSLPTVGRFGIPEVEKIVVLKPNWVIANDFMNPNVAGKLRELGIETTLAQINSVADYLKWLEIIGKKLNKNKELTAALNKFESEKRFLQQLKPLPLKVLWVVNAKPLIVAGSGSLPDSALKLMQLENAAGMVKKEYFKCSAEWVLNSSIDLMIWGVPGTPEKSGAFWKKVPAVRAKRVIYHHVYSPITRPGPRFLSAVKAMRQDIEAKIGAKL